MTSIFLTVSTRVMSKIFIFRVVERNAETSYQKSLKLFPDKDKSITLFDRDTIQYGPNINL